MLNRLAETDAGIDDDPGARDARRLGPRDARLKKIVDVEQDVIIARVGLHRRGRALRMHQAERHAGVNNFICQMRIERQGRDIVNKPRAARQRFARHGGLARVDGNRHPDLALIKRADHRGGAGDLFLDAHIRRAGPGAFAADVQHVGPGGNHGTGMGDGAVRRGKAAAVGKAVGRDVQHAHDPRPVKREARERPARRGQAAQHGGGQRTRWHQPARAAPGQVFDMAEPGPAPGKGKGAFGAKRIGLGDRSEVIHGVFSPSCRVLASPRCHALSTGTRHSAGSVTAP